MDTNAVETGAHPPRPEEGATQSFEGTLPRQPEAERAFADLLRQVEDEYGALENKRKDEEKAFWERLLNDPDPRKAAEYLHAVQLLNQREPMYAGAKEALQAYLKRQKEEEAPASPGTHTESLRGGEVSEEKRREILGRLREIFRRSIPDSDAPSPDALPSDVPLSPAAQKADAPLSRRGLFKEV